MNVRVDGLLARSRDMPRLCGEKQFYCIDSSVLFLLFYKISDLWTFFRIPNDRQMLLRNRKKKYICMYKCDGLQLPTIFFC